MRQVANVFKRIPFFVKFMTWLYRLGRPKFSAGVVGVVFNAAGEVLLVEHLLHPDHPWGLPGGWVDRGDGLASAVAREMREELELDVTVLRVIHVQIQYDNHIDIAFLCAANNTVGNLSPELLAYRWTATSNLPNVPPFHYDAIERALALRSDHV